MISITDNYFLDRNFELVKNRSRVWSNLAGNIYSLSTPCFCFTWPLTGLPRAQKRREINFHIGVVLDIGPRNWSWILVLEVGPGSWSWTLVLELGPGSWSWKLVLEVGPGSWSWELGCGYWSWNLVLELDPGYWPWKLVLEAGPGSWSWKLVSMYRKVNFCKLRNGSTTTKPCLPHHRTH